MAMCGIGCNLAHPPRIGHDAHPPAAQHAATACNVGGCKQVLHGVGTQDSKLLANAVKHLIVTY